MNIVIAVSAATQTVLNVSWNNFSYKNCSRI